MTRALPRALSAVLLGGLLAVALAWSLASPASASPEERRLDETRQRLDDLRRDLDAARDERDDEEEALAIAEERLDEVLSAVTEAQDAVERQRLAVADAEDELARLHREVEERQDSTGERIASLYKRGGDGGALALLSVDRPAHILRRGTLMDVVNRNDRSAFEEVAASRVAVDAQAQRLEEEQAALERVLDQEEELLAEVEELREDRAIALAEAEAEVEDLAEHEDYLLSEVRELEDAVRQASRRRTQDNPSRGGGDGDEPSGQQPVDSEVPEGGSGGWQWPAQGRVTSEYGMRWGRLHAGIDVAASHGAPVVAARGGTVTHAGAMGGYGNTVLIDHGGGVVTAYAHLSSFSVSQGQSVSAGQQIGGMGCTGSCTGTHVHFEVRVNGSAQNPRGYLP